MRNAFLSYSVFIQVINVNSPLTFSVEDKHVFSARLVSSVMTTAVVSGEIYVFVAVMTKYIDKTNPTSKAI